MNDNYYKGDSSVRLPEHGGNIHKLLREQQVSQEQFIDFSANINPCGPPPWLRSLVNRQLEMVTHYPDPDCTDLIGSIARHYQVHESSVIPANGTTELLHLLPCIIKRREIVIPVPSYSDYVSVFEKNKFHVAKFKLLPDDGFNVISEKLSSVVKGGEAVLFANPANPAGTVVPQSVVISLAQKHPETLFIIDEAFLDFLEDQTSVGGRLENIITLNSLTKFYAIPGLRIGFGIFPEKYAGRIRKKLPQWTVNSLAQAIGVKALTDSEYAERSRKTCAILRKELFENLVRFPELHVFESQANYFLLRLEDGSSAETLYQQCLKKNIIIRRCGNYAGLDDSFFRLAVRADRENKRLLEVFAEIFPSGQQRRKRKFKKKTRSLMFQGTSSNAGKSILTTALCRILLQDGFSVAPFKAQNMSLNSFVTHDGMEMGRAQVVQALAAKVEPDCLMNPILLKPNSDTGSQVIVRGRPVGNMNVKQYHVYKSEAWQSVVTSYDELSAQYDCIVLEGAGSPGEINLKHHDIVNMKMAAYANAPVLLVGDIDRGGVYASFAGIMDVLEEWERQLISGFVVNKFRGDVSLLDSAHRFLSDHTGRDVLGVIPYLSDLTLPQEDSVSMKDGFYRYRATEFNEVEIAVLDLPHISNFTDIDSLYFEPDVNIQIVKNPADINHPDAIIIPGSKNVASDLRYLREKGFYTELRNQAQRGCIIIGICGGYQMLGNKMIDPHEIETKDKFVEGVGLISVNTVLMEEKTLRRREGIHLPSNQKIVGYEIHHGITEEQQQPILSFTDGTTCGGSNSQGNVWGAYLHGIFDEDHFRRWFIDDLRQRKGLKTGGGIVAPYNVDDSINELADTVRSCCNMKTIYRLMGV